MNNIHKTAIVSDKAELGDNIEIGPYVIVHDDVKIDDETTIGPHSVIYDGARIGKNVKIYQGVSVSNTPQDLRFSGQKTYFEVGDNTVLREFVTLHRATVDGGYSRVGKNCFLMAYCHVAHDCTLGNNVILANCVNIGGHSIIEDYAIVGGGTPIHQFCRVGQHSMTGGGLVITVDVPPYVMAGHNPLRYSGLNSVGLKRRGFTPEDLSVIKRTYTLLYNSGMNFSQAKEKIEQELGGEKYAQTILEFLKGTKRTILRR